MSTFNCIPLAQVQDFASKDVNRIVGSIAKVLARKSPYINTFDGGVFDAGISDVVRSVVEEMGVPAGSLANPQFQNDIAMCGVGATPDQVGQTEYQYQIGTFRGLGPRVCVKLARAAFKGTYLATEQSMQKTILQLINADNRYQLLIASGVKFVVNTTQPFSANLTGDMQAINTLFAPVPPTGPLNWKTLYKLATFLREEMLAEPFTAKESEYFKGIFSIDQNEILRDGSDVLTDARYLTAGQFKLGEDIITGYTFTGYRTIALGYDQQPLRATGYDAFGNLALVNPIVAGVVSKGFGQRRNPIWVNALWEVGFLIAGDSFKRLIPEQYVGEGTFKFAPQLSMGELRWVSVQDWDCNLWQDYGQHIYQIQRAYRPIHPQNVIAVLYLRCPFDGLPLPCNSSATGL